MYIFYTYRDEDTILLNEDDTRVDRRRRPHVPPQGNEKLIAAEVILCAGATRLHPHPYYTHYRVVAERTQNYYM